MYWQPQAGSYGQATKVRLSAVRRLDPIPARNNLCLCMQSGNADATHSHGWLFVYDEIGAYKPLSIRALRPARGRMATCASGGREIGAPVGRDSSYKHDSLPVTVFDTKGIPASRRERVQAAVEAGGKQVTELYEARIAADRQGVRVLISGPVGFERTVQFTLDADSFEITEQVRATLED